MICAIEVEVAFDEVMVTCFVQVRLRLHLMRLRLHP